MGCRGGRRYLEAGLEIATAERRGRKDDAEGAKKKPD